ncbi:MAG: hypothetical protein PHY59_03435 [Methanobacterium sp.]|nr:hypothetical protein [Methanobacterium sp.]
MGLIDSLTKKTTKELKKQVKDKGGKELEKRATKELKKRLKI